MLFHLDRAGASIRKVDEAVLVEGYMDAIAVAAAGIDQVVATCGTSLTGSQVRLLGRYTRRVVVNYDPDSAGLAATERSLDLLLDKGFECRVLVLPGGLDPDAFIRKSGGPAYEALLKAAPNYLDYLADRAAAKHDLRTPEGKVAAANAVLPFVVRLPNALLRAEWSDRLADRLRLDGRLLREEFRQAGRRSGRSPAAESKPNTPAGESADTSPAERELLRGCLENEALADEFLPALAEDGALDGLATARIFHAIVEARRRGDKCDLAQMDEILNPAEQRLAYDCQFSGLEPLSHEAAERCARALRRRRMERRRDEVQAELRLAEKDGDAARVSELLKKKLKVAGELSQFGRS